MVTDFPFPSQDVTNQSLPAGMLSLTKLSLAGNN